MGTQKVLRAENLVKNRLLEQPHLQHDLSHTASRTGALTAHQVAIVMTDHRIEIGDDSDRVQHIATTYLLIGLDPHDSQYPKG